MRARPSSPVTAGASLLVGGALGVCPRGVGDGRHTEAAARARIGEDDPVAKGFKINQRELDKMMREIQSGVDKTPIRVPIQADTSSVTLPTGTVVNNYHGPVVTVTSGQAQIAWGNNSVQQGQQTISQGYEDLAKSVAEVLTAVDQLGLSETDASDVRTQAEVVLQEVTKEKPDSGLIRQGVTMLKGLLTAALTSGASELAKQLIQNLGA